MSIQVQLYELQMKKNCTDDDLHIIHHVFNKPLEENLPLKWPHSKSSFKEVQNILDGVYLLVTHGR